MWKSNHNSRYVVGASGAEIKEREWWCENENGDRAGWSRVRIWVKWEGHESSLKHGGREGDVRWRDDKKRQRQFALLHLSGRSPPSVYLFGSLSLHLILTKETFFCFSLCLSSGCLEGVWYTHTYVCLCVCPEALLRNWWAVLKSCLR